LKGRNKTALTPWQVAATYMGTIVGAGFASGQEMLQFFGAFGIWGVMGLALAGYLFYYFGNIILQLGKELKAESRSSAGEGKEALYPDLPSGLKKREERSPDIKSGLLFSS
jgi:hypothetical protein